MSTEKTAEDSRENKDQREKPLSGPITDRKEEKTAEKLAEVLLSPIESDMEKPEIIITDPEAFEPIKTKEAEREFFVGQLIKRYKKDGSAIEGVVIELTKQDDGSNLIKIRLESDYSRNQDPEVETYNDQDLRAETYGTKEMYNFLEKRVNMAMVANRTINITSTQWQELSDEEIFGKITQDIQLSEGQKTLIDQKISQIRSHISLTEEIRGEISTPQGRKKLVEDLYGEASFDTSVLRKRGFELDHDVEIIIGGKRTPSAVFIIMEETDYLRFKSSPTTDSWSNLTEKRKQELRAANNSAGFYKGLDCGENIKGNISFVLRHKFSSDEGTIEHEEVHYLNQMFGVRKDFSHSDSHRFLDEQDYDKYLQFFYDGQLNLAHDEITAFLTNHPPAETIRYLTNMKSSYTEDFRICLWKVARELKDPEFEAKFMESYDDMLDKYKEFVEKTVNIATHILNFPNGHELLIVTPIEQWENLFNHLRQTSVEKPEQWESLEDDKGYKVGQQISYFDDSRERPLFPEAVQYMVGASWYFKVEGKITQILKHKDGGLNDKIILEAEDGQKHLMNLGEIEAGMMENNTRNELGYNRIKRLLARGNRVEEVHL
ncbi:MAG: hypothetical protein HQ530_03615 [Parcubacteria group bacterium]|nr:hypothetical protein [Parcubacteria group bacterium]